jgi:hypothetical protein
MADIFGTIEAMGVHHVTIKANQLPVSSMVPRYVLQLSFNEQSQNC